MGPIQNQIRSFVDAIRFLSNRDEPRNLIAQTNKLQDEPCTPLTEDDLVEVLIDSAPGQTIQILLGDLISAYDRFPGDADSWVGKTRPHTDERRNLSYKLLGLDKKSSDLISKFRPVPLAADRPTVIGDQEDFKRWYLPSRENNSDFYWDNFRHHLRTKRGLDEKSINSLDVSSSEIVGRLADPTSSIPFSARGVIVGYVQSGKTTNFTAVIAKAIDAGYRFVIVLTGMHEALRRQTQRRLDMELIGKPNILGDLSETSAIQHPAGQYLDDREWPAGGFSDLRGKRPSPGIIRLTDYKNDYSNQQTHLLNMVAPNDFTNLFDPKRLHNENARIAIIKKNATVITHLLKSIEMCERTTRQLPTLIIDDESDQASVNTAKLISYSKVIESKEEKEKRQRRTAINEKISKILERMPRAQYIGYTATPFANVFVDYEDDYDLFPKDFLIALDEPKGYMGTSTFFSSTGRAPDKEKYKLSNKQAYIRELLASKNDLNMQESELTEAIASFIVTGAIKLFRLNLNSSYERSFRHHTMLIHEAAWKKEHARIKKIVRSIWDKAEWRKNSSSEILRSSFLSLQPTMKDRGESPSEIPMNFEDIEPYIKRAIEKIESSVYSASKSPILVVNGEAESEDLLDFDRKETWKIIVGGAMLSRGFTIEGLTISYFRRASRAHDTLLQMGRWFGYRYGYQDLVRIYLAANASISKNLNVNLYDAFREIAVSEEAFRNQLALYSAWDGDYPAITPRQIRPLVLQNLPWLKPTAAAKMQLAKIKRQYTDLLTPKAMGFNEDEVVHNWKLSTSLVKAATRQVQLTGKPGSDQVFPAFVGEISVADLTDYLKNCFWIGDYYERVIRPKAAHYDYCANEGILKNFILILPQFVREPDHVVQVEGLGKRDGVTRRRNNEDYYGEFTAEPHRDAVLKDILPLTGPSSKVLSASIGQGVILAYVIPERGKNGLGEVPSIVPEFKCTLGLNIYLPGSAKGDGTAAPIEWEGTSRVKS